MGGWIRSRTKLLSVSIVFCRHAYCTTMAESNGEPTKLMNQVALLHNSGLVLLIAIIPLLSFIILVTESKVGLKKINSTCA